MPKKKTAEAKVVQQTFALRPDQIWYLQELHEETRIPKNDLAREAFDLLRQKYKKPE